MAPVLHELATKKPWKNTPVPTPGFQGRLSLNRNYLQSKMLAHCHVHEWCQTGNTICTSFVTAFNEAFLILYRLGFLLRFQFTYSSFPIFTVRPFSSSKPNVRLLPPAVNLHTNLSIWCAEVSPGVNRTTFKTAVLAQMPSQEYCSHFNCTQPKDTFWFSGLIYNAYIHAIKRSICQIFRCLLLFHL